MEQRKKVLAVIPARGGSKGVPRKNIRLLCGRPLITYTIEQALATRDLFHRIIVSTDDEEIASVARACGAEVPFLRPAHLARDESPVIPMLQHAVNFVEAKDSVLMDWVCLLQPTEPFRLTTDVEQCLEMGFAGGSDSVISVVRVFATHPILMKKIENDRLLPFFVDEREGTRRQDYEPPAYMRNGAIYLTRRDVLMNQGSIWGRTIRPYVMPLERSVSIDSEIDFKLAEILMSEQHSFQESGKA